MSLDIESAKKAVMVNLSTTAKVAQWSQPLPVNGLCDSVAISGDGSAVVAGTYFYNTDTTAAKTKTMGVQSWDGTGTSLWQDTFACTAASETPAGVVSVSMTNDGAWTAAGGLDNTAHGFISVYTAAGVKTTLFNPPSIVTGVALSGDGNYLAAGADKLYISKFNSTTNGWGAPQGITVNAPPGTVKRVSISDDGAWIVAAYENGWVALIQNQLGGAINATIVGKWQSPTAKYIQNVAMAADGSAFAAGCADGLAYYFDVSVFPASNAPRWHYDPSGQSVCRWVDISDDGTLMSAVFSYGGVHHMAATKGRAYLLRNNPGAGSPLYTRVWTSLKHMPHGPNCVAMAKKSGNYYIAAADGVPNQATADAGFYLFDGATGDSLWGTAPNFQFTTAKMNYVIAMSSDGSAAFGGSNDGNVYYFAVP